VQTAGKIKLILQCAWCIVTGCGGLARWAS
jgi:hypothetical protein